MSPTTTISTPRSLLLRLAVSLVLVPLSVGCGAGKAAWLEPRGVAFDARPARDAETVEVWLDEKPADDIEVVADLQVVTTESTASIRKMRERAALAGLDGIYWIDCASACSGECTARGFVYTGRARVRDGQRVASR